MQENYKSLKRGTHAPSQIQKQQKLFPLSALLARQIDLYSRLLIHRQLARVCWLLKSKISKVSINNKPDYIFNN